jgi:hypothetical protein
MFDPLDDGSMEKPLRKHHRPHINRGPQITERLEEYLRINGQQGVLRFDQAQRWLARLSPEPDRMKQHDILSAERTRKILRPWIDESLLFYKVFYAHQKGTLWLSIKGLKYVNLSLRYYDPAPASLPHLYAVNDIRLLIAARRPHDTWRSERELRSEQNARGKGSVVLHLPDAELISANRESVIAIECELTVKSEKRLQDALYDLAANKRYSTMWYFCPEQVYDVLRRSIAKLPPEHRNRFVLYTLEGKLYRS